MFALKSFLIWSGNSANVLERLVLSSCLYLCRLVHGEDNKFSNFDSDRLIAIILSKIHPLPDCKHHHGNQTIFINKRFYTSSRSVKLRAVTNLFNFSYAPSIFIRGTITWPLYI